MKRCHVNNRILSSHWSRFMKNSQNNSPLHLPLTLHLKTPTLSGDICPYPQCALYINSLPSFKYTVFLRNIYCSNVTYIACSNSTHVLGTTLIPVAYLGGKAGVYVSSPPPLTVPYETIRQNWRHNSKLTALYRLSSYKYDTGVFLILSRKKKYTIALVVTGNLCR